MLTKKVWIKGKLATHQVELPAKRIVCPRCDGSGSHVNPNIDGNGITGEEMDQLGEEFRENYMSGFYDVTCEECHGRNVIEEIDRDQLTPKMLKRLEDMEREEAYWRQEEESERRWMA